MLMKLRKIIKRANNQNGFTLVELIIVMAILALLAGIAVPRYQDIRAAAAVRADAATATSIVNACRMQETETGTLVVGLAGVAPALQAQYMTPGAPQSGGAWALANVAGNYVITWTPTAAAGAAPYNVQQTVTEGQRFVLVHN